MVSRHYILGCLNGSACMRMCAFRQRHSPSSCSFTGSSNFAIFRKIPTSNFWNNWARNESIWIVFGTQNRALLLLFIVPVKCSHCTLKTQKSVLAISFFSSLSSNCIGSQSELRLLVNYKFAHHVNFSVACATGPKLIRQFSNACYICIVISYYSFLFNCSLVSYRIY